MATAINGKGGLVGALALLGGVIAVRRWRARSRVEDDLGGEVALITGGSRGLGLLLARELLRAGCRVAICARDGAELERARRRLAADGDVFTIVADVGEREQGERLIEQVIAHHGRLDVLVANAGVIAVGPVATMSGAQFEQALDVMYRGAVYPTLAALPAMRDRRHGRIVLITSIGGKVSVPHLLPYSGAKFAAVGFGEGLRAELAGTGVHVTTIVPGLLRTGSHLNARFQGDANGEYGWFALGATLPLLSMDAERAARQIVRAVRRREAERTLSVPATLLQAGQALMPGTTATLLGVVNRLVLPKATGATSERTGQEVVARHRAPVRHALTALGRRAARRFNQLPGPRVPAQPGRLAPDDAAPAAVEQLPTFGAATAMSGLTKPPNPLPYEGRGSRSVQAVAQQGLAPSLVGKGRAGWRWDWALVQKQEGRSVIRAVSRSSLRRRRLADNQASSLILHY